MANNYWVTSPTWDQTVNAAWERRRAEVEFARTRVTPELADRVAQIAGMYGNVMQPGTVLAAAQMGANGPEGAMLPVDEDPVVTQLAQMEADRELDEGFLGGAHRLARGTVRNLFTAFDWAADSIVRRPIRAGIQAVSGDNDDNFMEAMRDQVNRPHAGRQAFDQLMSGEDVTLGEGWLPGGENFAMQRAQAGDITSREMEMFIDPSRPEYDPEYLQELQRQMQTAPTFNGQPLSAGRFVASVYEPGTKPYNLLSGTIDGSIAFFLDPAARAGKAAGVLRQAHRQFGTASEYLGTGRVTVNPQKAADFLDSSHGQSLLDYLAKTNDFEQIHMLLSNKGRHSSVGRELVNRLSDTTDPNAIRQIIEPELGAAIRERPALTRHRALSTQLPGISRSVRDIRLMNDMPSQQATLSLQNLDDGITDFRNYLVNARVSPEQRSQLMADYGRVSSLGDLESVVVRAAGAVDLETVARTGRNYKIGEGYQNYFARLRNDLSDMHRADIANGGPNVVSIGGELVDTLGDVTLVSEFTNAAVPLVDARTVRQATSKMHELVGKLPGGERGLGMMTKTLEGFVNVWEPLQLMRLAWTVRVLGEQQARMFAMGVRNQLHPAEMISMMLGLNSGQVNRTISGDAMRVLAERRAALTTGTGGWLSTPEMKFNFRDKQQYHKHWGKNGEPEKFYLDRWADELGVLMDDNTTRQVARAMTDPEFKVTVPGQAARQMEPEEAARSALYRAEREELVDFGEFMELNSLLRQGDYDQIIARLEAPTATTATEAQELTGIEAVKYWFWEGEGAQYRNQLATDKGRAVAFEANRRGSTTDPHTQILFHREEADRYIDGVIERIHEFTRNDVDLIQGIHRGEFQIGKRTYSPLDPHNSKKINSYLRQHIESGPDTVWGPQYRSNNPTLGQQWDDFVGTTFEFLMSKPDNRFFRDPTFTHSYWQRIDELSTRIQTDDLARIIREGPDNAINPQVLKRLEGDLAKRGGKQIDQSTAIAFEDVDALARSFGLDQVRTTLYDLNRRSQITEAARLVAPFLEAWREVLMTWTRLSARNPAALRRAQQGYQGARDGMFYVDENGNEVFAYPGGGIIGKAMGLPEGMAAQAQVSGLNLVAASVLPGVGPVVQWPAGAIGPDHVINKVADFFGPEWLIGDRKGSDLLRAYTNPFGASVESISDIPAQMMPAWMRSFVNGITDGSIDERAIENLTAQIMKANVAQGRVPQDEVQANYEMARSTAVNLTILQGVLNSGLPTTFQPRINVTDMDGRIHTLEALAREYRTIQEQFGDDQEMAVAAFMEMFGLDPLMIAQPRSRQTTPRTTMDRGGAMWERQNIAAKDHYDAIFGLLAPLDGEPADFSAWEQVLKDGDIIHLDARQQMMLANNTIGYATFFAAKEQLDALGDQIPNDDKDFILKQYRAMLRERYEGFDIYIPGVPDRPDLQKDELPQLRRALEDPGFADLPSIQAARQYMRARDGLEAWLQAERGVGLSAAKNAADIREVLNAHGEQLANDNPDFRALWTRVLSREVS